MFRIWGRCCDSGGGGRVKSICAYNFLVTNPIIIYRVHAVQRMFERRTSHKKARQTLKAGETIEDHSDELTSPSRLILGWEGKRPIHVVVSENAETNETVVITVYSPEPSQWTKDFKRRR